MTFLPGLRGSRRLAAANPNYCRGEHLDCAIGIRTDIVRVKIELFHEISAAAAAALLPCSKNKRTKQNCQLQEQKPKKCTVVRNTSKKRAPEMVPRPAATGAARSPNGRVFPDLASTAVAAYQPLENCSLIFGTNHSKVK